MLDGGEDVVGSLGRCCLGAPRRNLPRRRWHSLADPVAGTCWKLFHDLVRALLHPAAPKDAGLHFDQELVGVVVAAGDPDVLSGTPDELALSACAGSDMELPLSSSLGKIMSPSPSL
jgi:hypothetical protein